MTRDLHLLVHVMKVIEGRSDCGFARTITVDGVNQVAIDYHINLLIEAGLLRGQVGVGFHHLTLAGHDFLDLMRCDIVRHRLFDALGATLDNAPLALVRDRLIAEAKAIMDKVWLAADEILADGDQAVADHLQGSGAQGGAHGINDPAPDEVRAHQVKEVVAGQGEVVEADLVRVAHAAANQPGLDQQHKVVIDKITVNAINADGAGQFGVSPVLDGNHHLPQQVEITAHDGLLDQSGAGKGERQ